MGGLVRNFKGDGTLVRSGEVPAAVSDPFGEEEIDIEAPFEGIIVGRTAMPVVNEDDAAFHIGSVKSVAMAAIAVEDIEVQPEDDPIFDEDEIIRWIKSLWPVPFVGCFGVRSRRVPRIPGLPVCGRNPPRALRQLRLTGDPFARSVEA